VTTSPFETFVKSISDLDARKDRHLREYFVETSTFNSIVENPRQAELVIGLKGSGKTALYSMLTDQSTILGGGQNIKIGMSPSQSCMVTQDR